MQIKHRKRTLVAINYSRSMTLETTTLLNSGELVIDKLAIFCEKEEKQD
jgi:hypothetical protein